MKINARCSWRSKLYIKDYPCEIWAWDDGVTEIAIYNKDSDSGTVKKKVIKTFSDSNLSSEYRELSTLVWGCEHFLQNDQEILKEQNEKQIQVPQAKPKSN